MIKVAQHGTPEYYRLREAVRTVLAIITTLMAVFIAYHLMRVALVFGLWVTSLWNLS